MNCHWLPKLSDYVCRPVSGLAGEAAIEVGTPFEMCDGSPITLYLIEQGLHLLISDNGDTLTQVAATGADPFRHLPVLRRRVQRYGLTLTEFGAFEVLTQPDLSPIAFARAVSGLLQVADWGAEALRAKRAPPDLAAEALPYIVARNPKAALERHRPVIGASNATHVFDILHGGDLIDVISPKAQATGAEMRKVGDVQNGPFAEGLRPIVIVDDRQDFARAEQEIAILSSITRAMPFSELAATRH
jgi:hypothetical protein